MNYIYICLGVSKQAIHQYHKREMRMRSIENQVLLLVEKIRKDHPTMGLRDMYHKINPPSIGRDCFEQMCKQNGLKSKKSKNYRKTTDNTGVYRFPNLIIEQKIQRINQVWQSDITYYECAGKFYYITFIQDSYSKKIIGHQVSKHLITEHTAIPALMKALQERKKMNIEGVILHSDGGGQYYDKEYLKITKAHKIQNSMCEMAWENGMAERLNGVIKNNYLKHREIKIFEHLVKEVDRSVKLYNSDKPHIKLRRKTPEEFEKEYICDKRKTDSDKSATDKTMVHTANLGPMGQKRKTSGSISL